MLARMMVGTAARTLQAIPGSSMHRVVNREDWARVRALRNDAAPDQGTMGSSRGSHADAHDFASNASTFLLLSHGRAIGSTRTSVGAASRRSSLPAAGTFPREMRECFGPLETLVEASLTVADPAAGLDRRAIRLHLLKASIVACAAERADWLVCAVREREIGFHRRMLDMEILSGAEHASAIDEAHVLMGLRYREQHPVLFRRFPLLAVSLRDHEEYAATGRIAFADSTPRQNAA
jgi:hypothetical protein